MMSTGFFDQFINSFASQKVNSGSTHKLVIMTTCYIGGHKIFTAPWNVATNVNSTHDLWWLMMHAHMHPCAHTPMTHMQTATHAYTNAHPRTCIHKCASTHWQRHRQTQTHHCLPIKWGISSKTYMHTQWILLKGVPLLYTELLLPVISHFPLCANVPHKFLHHFQELGNSLSAILQHTGSLKWVVVFEVIQVGNLILTINPIYCIRVLYSLVFKVITCYKYSYNTLLMVCIKIIVSMVHLN